MADPTEPAADQRAIRRCQDCGENFAGPHDCDAAIEARALFEAAKRANTRESGIRLADAAYAMAIAAEMS